MSSSSEPGDYPSEFSGSDASSSISSASSAGAFNDKPVAPYVAYLPVAKRTQLAQREFEVAMMEREIKLAELDKERQKFLAPKRRPYTVPFFLVEEKLKLATSRFPRTLFRVGNDCGHDHPLGHLETMIGTDSVARMFRAGDTILDIYSSPKVVARLNAQQVRSNNPKTFHSVCKIMTEKDYLRQTGWDGLPHFLLEEGETMEEVFDCASWFAPRGEVKPRIMLMAIHTIYYMTDETIAVMLSRPGTKMIALIHRHKDDKGTLFLDEMDYAKKDGMVEQVNRATGERYTHRDVSWLFTSTTKVRYSDKGAFCWTLHKVTDETWIVELVACPENMNERFSKRVKDTDRLTAVMELNEHSEVPTPFPHRQLATIPGAECVMVAGLPIVRLKGSDVKVNITCPELIEFIALHVSGKPRDTVRLADCFALAVAHVDDGMDFPGKLRFKVHSNDLAGHVLLGYMTSFGSELEVVRALPAFRTFFVEHRAHLEGHSLMAGVSDSSLGTASAVQALRRFNEAHKQGNVVDGVLHALNM
jgi:hypothetical protein